MEVDRDSGEVPYVRCTEFDDFDAEVETVVSAILSEYDKSCLVASEVSSSLERQGFKRVRNVRLWDDPSYRDSFSRGGLAIEVHEAKSFTREDIGPFAKINIRACDGRYLNVKYFSGLN